MAERSEEKKVSKFAVLFFATIFGVIYLVAFSYPFIDAYIIRPVSFDRHVEPELMIGLLTASSILFGFSSLLVVRWQRIPRAIWLFLLPPLILIIFSGGLITDVSLGHSSEAWALLVLSACFNVNAVSTGFIVLLEILLET